MSFKFTTLITKGEKFYVAKCLELGVVSQGKTIEEAKANIKEAVDLYLEDESVELPVFQLEPMLAVMEV
ncbi:type II toxin-antitoxin system HicB family antitoxin [bacterium]|nr:type II toxin-antitoxin system HicB family antitoxin [bacterium]